MVWGVSKDDYINLDIDLEVMRIILGEYIVPKFVKYIKGIKSIEKCYMINRRVLSGNVYYEQVLIEFSFRERNLDNYLLLVDEVEFIFKLFGLSRQDFKVIY